MRDKTGCNLLPPAIRTEGKNSCIIHTNEVDKAVTAIEIDRDYKYLHRCNNNRNTS